MRARFLIFIEVSDAYLRARARRNAPSRRRQASVQRDDDYHVAADAPSRRHFSFCLVGLFQCAHYHTYMATCSLLAIIRHLRCCRSCGTPAQARDGLRAKRDESYFRPSTPVASRSYFISFSLFLARAALRATAARAFRICMVRRF